MKRSQVVVGNIGQVCDESNAMKAWATYQAYIAISKAKHGRGAGEPVTLFDRNEIKAEYFGTNQPEF